MNLRGIWKLLVTGLVAGLILFSNAEPARTQPAASAGARADAR